MGYLVGDCLVGAAFLSYAGPFLSDYRDELVQETWLKQVRIEVLLYHLTSVVNICTSDSGAQYSMQSFLFLCDFPIKTYHRQRLEHPGIAFRRFLH